MGSIKSREYNAKLIDPDNKTDSFSTTIDSEQIKKLVTGETIEFDNGYKWALFEKPYIYIKEQSLVLFYQAKTVYVQIGMSICEQTKIRLGSLPISHDLLYDLVEICDNGIDMSKKLELAKCLSEMYNILKNSKILVKNADKEYILVRLANILETTMIKLSDPNLVVAKEEIKTEYRKPTVWELFEGKLIESQIDYFKHECPSETCVNMMSIKMYQFNHEDKMVVYTILDCQLEKLLRGESVSRSDDKICCLTKVELVEEPYKEQKFASYKGIVTSHKRQWYRLYFTETNRDGQISHTIGDILSPNVLRIFEDVPLNATVDISIDVLVHHLMLLRPDGKNGIRSDYLEKAIVRIEKCIAELQEKHISELVTIVKNNEYSVETKGRITRIISTKDTRVGGDRT